MKNNKALITAGVCAFAVLAGAPAFAQETNELTPADLISEQTPDDIESAASQRKHQAAAAPVVSADAILVGDLGRLYAERLVAEAKASLAEAKGESEKDSSNQSRNISQSKNDKTEDEPDYRYIPSVQMVKGSGQLKATLIYPGGGIVFARVGQPLLGGYTVDTIQIDQVLIKDKEGKLLRLGFSGAPPVPVLSAENNAGPQMGDMGDYNGFDQPDF